MDIPRGILDWKETAEIETCGDMRGNSPDARLMLFIRLAVMSLGGLRFRNASQFERSVRRSSHAVKQAQTVWDTCIRLGILTDDGRGFSLSKWLESKTRENLPSEGPVLAEATKYTTEPQKTRQEEKQAAKNGIVADAGVRKIPVDMPVGKIPVRENVTLTPAEIEGIKARYGAENYDAILDRLSLYKKSSGRPYASDAAAIDSWVARAVTQESRRRGMFDYDESTRIFKEALKECRRMEEARRQ